MSLHCLGVVKQSKYGTKTAETMFRDSKQTLLTLTGRKPATCINPGFGTSTVVIVLDCFSSGCYSIEHNLRLRWRINSRPTGLAVSHETFGTLTGVELHSRWWRRRFLLLVVVIVVAVVNVGRFGTNAGCGGSTIVGLFFRSVCSTVSARIEGTSKSFPTSFPFGGMSHSGTTA